MPFRRTLPYPCLRHRAEKYALLAVEHLTAWPVTWAAKLQTSVTAIQFFKKEVIAPFWSLCFVVTDNGPAFTSFTWGYVLKELGTMPKRVAPYSAESNGRAERIVQTMKDDIKQIYEGSSTE